MQCSMEGDNVFVFQKLLTLPYLSQGGGAGRKETSLRIWVRVVGAGSMRQRSRRLLGCAKANNEQCSFFLFFLFYFSFFFIVVRVIGCISKSHHFEIGSAERG